MLFSRFLKIIFLLFFYLDMKEPVYEFDQGPRFVPQFEKYPKEQVFNW